MAHHLDNHRPGEDDQSWLLIFGEPADGDAGDHSAEQLDDVWCADAPPHPLAGQDGVPASRDGLRSSLGEARRWGRRAG